ncbi:deoxynucleoside triphosphate triphosphohydrolase SAMHD1-like isoform X2 [Paramacrobiotus metropolitanus]|uniref:deoxynucleoside triphosphate triphosphohydrolase SAMHD1-like isoform X2 n=1 Tax=Paramacrobiotus metropolitanus TaxID=2943436 RepID=UPI0024463848|nr:deoxynucleoside triphosphate triphosphohydrolase SAMHD1-like isoform X2 [Paramacrobiotus metropolitanus]XP_055333597.1 deoxynucleoside triphosphate triphosphohydrolase SAMHD1-like isoform X2 [Paramacrobiotus metropolitanus]XP_055333600.1 deoxynucleoside triphosphate triphosphohydrolase SAMHD1-like isoform X2 [Paramacrobiotus metropolitanus]
MESGTAAELWKTDSNNLDKLLKTDSDDLDDLSPEMPIDLPSELSDYLDMVGKGEVPFLSIDDECEIYGKVLNDVIHGSISLHPLLIKFIDTEEFQRLREIKALGMTSLLFPTANHKRFEHSIGVSHLAGQFVQALDRKHPELEISRSEILCVMLAGLLHDIGHGPFSHTFEKFMRAANPTAQWTHEQASLDMIDYLITKKDLLPTIKAFGLGDEDIRFIKELIFGPLNGCQEVTARPKKRHFLYEIVSNKINGIDVDKWDYLARDGYQVDEGGSFDHQRFITHSRVAFTGTGNDRRRCIMFRDKEVGNFYDMFNARYRMHKKVYRHRVSLILDEMIVDVMKAADGHLRLKGLNGTFYKLSEAFKDMAAYARLDDGSIRTWIKNDDSLEMEEAKALWKRIDERKLYCCIGRTEPRESIDQTIDTILEELTAMLVKMPDANFISAERFRKNVIILKNEFDYGKKDENPLDHVLFFEKKKLNYPKTISSNEVSKLLPTTFSETEILFLYRSEDKIEQRGAAAVVEAWAKFSHFSLKNSTVKLSEIKYSKTTKLTPQEVKMKENAKRKLDFYGKGLPLAQ